MPADKGVATEAPAKHTKKRKRSKQDEKGSAQAAQAAPAAGPTKQSGKSSRAKKVTKVAKGELQSYKHALQRVKAQLQKVKQQEHLMDICATEGWKGGSRERAPLTEAIEHAERGVLRAKMVIRECVKYCEEAKAGKRIPPEAYDASGELDVKDIFCGVCGIYESQDDNDIILCDGCCGCAYHERCLDPPVNAADIDDDDNWLCWACQAKEDILEEVNEHFGTSYTLDHKWHEIFADADAERVAQAKAGAGGEGAAGQLGFLGMDLPSEDEEDEDFEAEEGDSAGDNGESSSGSEDGARGGSSSSGGESSPEQEAAAATSPAGSQEEAASLPANGSGGGRRKRRRAMAVPEEGEEGAGPSDKPARGRHRSRATAEQVLDAGGAGTNGLVISHKRRRPAPGYFVKLNDEFFGGYLGGSSEESDHDFKPGTSPA